MLRVRTAIWPSRIEGIGIFAKEPISKGMLIWKFDIGFDMLIPKEKVAEMPDVPRHILEKHGADEGGFLRIVLDEAKYFNHSYYPNCVHLGGSVEEYHVLALRDIEVGEEMTLDYRTLCDDPWYGFEVPPCRPG